LTADGTRVLVTLGHANHLAVVNAASKQIEAYVLVGNRPWSVAATRDGSVAFVANGLSDDITVIDLATLKPIVSVPVGRVPHTVLVDD
jgi:YVTN family beta-propeller protein